MQNRLEQLRQRQREQALKVQEELGGKLAGGATEDLDDAAAARQAAEMAAEEMDLGDDVDASDEVAEPYDREMSPELIEGNKLSYEDRTLPIVDEEESLRAMVSGRRVVWAAVYRADIDIPYAFSVRRSSARHLDDLYPPDPTCHRRPGDRQRALFRRPRSRKVVPRRSCQKLGRRRRVLQPRRRVVQPGYLQLGGQVQGEKAEVLQPSSYWIRMEQVQSDALRVSGDWNVVGLQQRLTFCPPPWSARTTLLPRSFRVTNSTSSIPISCECCRHALNIISPNACRCSLASPCL